METKRTWGKAIIAVILLLMSAIANAKITDVNIVPAIPTTLDLITIETYGIESSGDVDVTNTDFYQNGTLLELDIYLNVGHFAVETPWSHDESIGTLSAGMYDLTVRTLEGEDVTSTYFTSFEVVPEPATILLLSLGANTLRKHKMISYYNIQLERGC